MSDSDGGGLEGTKFKKKYRKAEYVQRRVRLSMYSRLCMKMSSFLFERACAMPRMVYLSCGIPFPV